MTKKTEVILPNDPSELRYVNLPEKERLKKAKEDVKTRLLAKVKSNPLIPIGSCPTIFLFR